MIAEQIVAIMVHSSAVSRPRAEPHPNKASEGPATKAVVDADSATWRELDSIIRRVRDKLDRE